MVKYAVRCKFTFDSSDISVSINSSKRKKNQDNKILEKKYKTNIGKSIFEEETTLRHKKNLNLKFDDNSLKHNKNCNKTYIVT